MIINSFSHKRYFLISGILLGLMVFLLSSCDLEGLTGEDASDGGDGSEAYSSSDGEGFGGSGSSSGVGSGSGSGEQSEPGTITAGEWNDLDNWSFWDTLMNDQDYSAFPAYWGLYNNNRIAVEVVNSSAQAVVDLKLDLMKNDVVIWSARTDNRGKAELWIDLFQLNSELQISNYSLSLNDGAQVINSITEYNNGINQIEYTGSHAASNRVELAFVVDATGSMSDELEYLKVELQDVIDSVQTVHANLDLATGAVFYRDEGDDYLTRLSAFSEDDTTTINFIRNQSASGGGDYPEAVHTALDKAVNNLQWSTQASTRLMFLLLDAPPHYETDIVLDIHGHIQEAARRGIKIIPIMASGINKETEFLMRFTAITTNGTYVFITDDSGVGGEHLEPTVGEYQVEYLNDLLVRLINKYL